MPHVVGIDVSLTATGIADSDGGLNLVGSTGVLGMELYDRINAIDALAAEIVDSVNQRKPELVVVEGIEVARAAKGALVSLIDRAWLYLGVVRLLRMFDIGLAVATPASLKVYATGRGNATKNAVIDAVARRLPRFETGGNDNLCDAAVLCAMGCDRRGTPLALLPATHTRALDAVRWPTGWR